MRVYKSLCYNDFDAMMPSVTRATGTNFVTGLNNNIINKKKLSPIHITISLQLIDLFAGLLEIDVLQIKPTTYVKIIFDLPFYSYYTIHIC